MKSAVGIPQRESAVVVRSGRQLMDSCIHSPIPAIHVVEHGWCHQRVIKGSVENLFVLLIWSLNSDLRELALPGVMRRLSDFTEFPDRNFCFQVLQRPFDTDPGNAGLDIDHFT